MAIENRRRVLERLFLIAVFLFSALWFPPRGYSGDATEAKRKGKPPVPKPRRLLDQEIGFLEDGEVEIHRAGPFAGFRRVSQVRCAFRSDASGWVACPEYPDADRCQWTAVRAGKKIGEVLSEIPESPSGYPADVGLHIAVGMKGDLESTSRTSEFGGFPGYRVRPPIVLVRMPCFGDKDGWTRIQGNVPVGDDLFRCIKASVDRAFICDGDTPSTYTASDLGIGRRLRTADGRELVEVVFLAYPLYPNWCYRDASGAWRFLPPIKEERGLNGGMHLVDLGDYDNDGKTETLFWLDGYNRNGYRIFWADFRKHATFTWSYH